MSEVLNPQVVIIKLPAGPLVKTIGTVGGTIANGTDQVLHFEVDSSIYMYIRISTVISKASYDYLQPFMPHAHNHPVIINPLRCVGRCYEIYDLMDIRL